MLDEAVLLGAGDDDREEGDQRQSGRHVEVGRGSRSTMQHSLEERVLVCVQNVVIQQAEHLEDRQQADQVRGEDEAKQRQQKRCPRRRVLLAEVRHGHRIAQEFDDEFEGVHAARRHTVGLLQVASNQRSHHKERDGGHDPHHQHVLADGKVDAENRVEVNQRMFAVGDVANDGLAGVELLSGGSNCFLGLGSVFLDHRLLTASTPLPSVVANKSLQPDASPGTFR
jgi:hypothetical protein